jgi:hypothetical protein
MVKDVGRVPRVHNLVINMKGIISTTRSRVMACSHGPVATLIKASIKRMSETATGKCDGLMVVYT